MSRVGTAFPDAPAIATTDPEVQRLRAAVEARLLGGEVEQTRVGRFVVLERVGAGAMGVVYAAYDGELDRKVAIKMLHATRGDPQMRARLVREAQAMARLSHPNVVTVYETGVHEGCGFVAMEFVRGRTLRGWQADAKPTQAELLAAYAQAGRGLAAAHAAGVVHRDFKPDNVLVEGEASELRVRVADFGLASTRSAEATPADPTHEGDDDATMTRPGARMGTPGYMSPEQILGEPTDARSDQFAFCVALWEALVGRRPFAGRNSAEIFAAVLVGEIDPPPRGVMPPFVESALRTGLAHRSDRRHASMDALLRALADDPRRRRRRRLGIALALAIVPLGFVGLRAHTAVQARRCDARAASVDAVWNAEAETDVIAGLVGTAAVNADSTATRTSSELSAYADRLREATRSACRAIEIEHGLDDALGERAVSCLSAREHGLATLVDALAHADGPAVDNATRSVLLLPPPERCIDARALALDLPPPTEPERRAELRRIESELSASESLRRLGRDREALAKLEALEPAVAELGWPAADAKLAHRLAHMHVNVGAADRALELSQRAFYGAFRAGDDETMAMSATMVSHVLAILLAREAEAKHWDDLAVAAIARMAPAQRPMPELFHSSTQARRRLLAGDDVGAEESIDRALAEVESFYGPDHLLLSEPLLTLANIQCRRSAWHDCRVTHERAYAIVSAQLGDDHPWTARALAGLGVSVGHDGEPERGLALLADALAIDERLFGPDDYNCGVDHSYAGLVLLSSHQPERAIPELARALEIGEQTFPPTHPEVVLELINLGRAQREAGRLAEARTTLTLARDRQRPDSSADVRAELDGELAKLAEAER